MAKGIEPNCRYGHGLLVKNTPTNRSEEGETVEGAYFAVTFFQTRIDLGYGYSFEVWECQTCSYIELHDYGLEQT